LITIPLPQDPSACHFESFTRVKCRTHRSCYLPHKHWGLYTVKSSVKHSFCSSFKDLSLSFARPLLLPLSPGFASECFSIDRDRLNTRSACQWLAWLVGIRAGTHTMIAETAYRGSVLCPSPNVHLPSAANIPVPYTVFPLTLQSQKSKLSKGPRDDLWRHHGMGHGRTEVYKTYTTDSSQHTTNFSVLHEPRHVYRTSAH